MRSDIVEFITHDELAVVPLGCHSKADARVFVHVEAVVAVASDDGWSRKPCETIDNQNLAFRPGMVDGRQDRGGKAFTAAVGCRYFETIQNSRFEFDGQ